jgi:hypothetical protein
MNAVIAFRDPVDVLHSRAVAAFRTHLTNDFVLPASTYAEVLVAPIRLAKGDLGLLE